MLFRIIYNYFIKSCEIHGAIILFSVYFILFYFLFLAGEKCNNISRNTLYTCDERSILFINNKIVSGK